MIAGATCGLAAIAVAVPASAAAAPAPRITLIYGGLQVSGIELLASFTYCDGSARPARFRHLVRAYDRDDRLIGRRVTARLNRNSRCTSITALSVPTGNSVARSFSVKVTNLKTGRATTRRTTSIL
ncbi:MAG: hypothetical protein AB7I08_08645 [Thermoleophilia bacterium]